MYHYVSRLLICTTVMVGVCVPAGSVRDLRPNTQVSGVTATNGVHALCTWASQICQQTQIHKTIKQDQQQRGFGALGHSAVLINQWNVSDDTIINSGVSRAAAWLIQKRSVELLI